MKTSTLTIFFCLMVSLLFAQKQGFMGNLSNYIENLNVYEEGQEEPRAFYIPETHLSLNGKWKFHYSEVPEKIPANFFQTNFDDSEWDKIKVPSNWEMEGYGDKQFRNVSTTYSIDRPKNAPSKRFNYGATPKIPEFTVTPPNVPDEYNPTGAYRTTFILPDDWNGKEIFLRFEKVASASFVWVNGQEVGYNEGAQEPSEYNISPYLKSGKNTIAVLVVKFSDGYYLEGQDYWRLAGIFDDVWVLATPKVRLFDWQIITDLDKNYQDATLKLQVAVKNHSTSKGKYRVRTTLKYKSKVISNNESKVFKIGAKAKPFISLSDTINNPNKWTAATPNIYDLSIELLDHKEKVVDKVDTKIGFKETEIIGNTFYLNGVPVKLHSINSHMQHPELGHVMDEATIRKDFEILKQFNFNSIRTSHYPPVNKYLQLADEYGFYIIDEAGTEAHASEYMSEMPDYNPMYLDRVRKMVVRDRNYPSVLFWSAGNESGEGENITKVIEEGKRLDPTRYWMYGGNADKHSGEEIIGPRYPTPIELELNYGLDDLDKRPSFMDEYLSIAGNGGGGMDEFWRVIYHHPQLMGGALWDFVSPGLTEPVRKLEDQSPYQTPVHIMGNAQLGKGQGGQAIDLNGHDQWLEVYRSDNVEITGNQLTIMMDVFPRRLNISSGALLSKGNFQFGIQQVGKDAIEFYIYTDKKHVLKCTLPDNWDNNWHQLMAVYDGAQMKLFIDKKEIGQNDVSGNIQNFPFPINIGRNFETHGQRMSLYTADVQLGNVGVFTKALTPESTVKAKDAVLWLDFEKETNEGTFYSIGIGARTYGAIWPDRTPQPEMWQMKKSVQPLDFTLINLEEGLVEVWNRSNFTNANYWEITWTLNEDEKVLQSGKLDLNVNPQSKDMVKIPVSKPAIASGKEYILNISSVLKEDEIWASKGFEVSWEQFELKEWKSPELIADDKELADLTENDTAFVISGDRFTYQLDKESGKLNFIAINDKEVLVAPLNLNVWRAPIANELDKWNGGTMRTKRWLEGFGVTLATDYYSSGIHFLKNKPLEVRAMEADGKAVIYIRELTLTHGGEKKYTISDRYRIGLTLSGFESIYEYHFYKDGSVVIKHKVQPHGTMPQFLPRIGVSLMLAPQLQNVEWYGRGPQENYPDRKTGYKIGIYQNTVENLYEPYLIPQDHALRTDNRWVRFTNEAGIGLQFSMNKHFNFNAYSYSTENLTRAYYTYQLQKANGITLNLDYATTGVGGTARPVLESYRVFPKAYEREIRIELIR
jgi:beta-galactosidase